MRYNLDKTWKLCLEMWAWIKKQIEAGSRLSVGDLKDKWAKDNGFENIWLSCFFCAYAYKEGATDCNNCPGHLIDPDFSCGNDEYHYKLKSLAFCQKLLELDKIRTGTDDKGGG